MHECYRIVDANVNSAAEYAAAGNNTASDMLPCPTIQLYSSRLKFDVISTAKQYISNLKQYWV